MLKKGLEDTIECKIQEERGFVCLVNTVTPGFNILALEGTQ